MKQNFSVLIVDDHPLISESYQGIFRRLEKDSKRFTFSIQTANSSEEAYEHLFLKEGGSGKDLILLDIQLPKSEKYKILSGEDLGEKIRNEYPNTKIMVTTSLNDNYRIINILKNVNPDCFLIKNDVTSKLMISVIEDVLQDKSYYSSSVLQAIRSMVNYNDLLDEHDRRIVYELSMGATMKDLEAVIPLSIPTLEKRKKNLRAIFEADKDRTLVINAKKKGFI